MVGLFISTCNQELDLAKISVDGRTAVTIVSISRGYPGAYEKGCPIEGLDLKVPPDSLVFQAGTTFNKDKQVVTNGGRVLAVTSFAEIVYEAVEKSRDVLENIDYDGIYYRRDIGYEFL